jgi:hypothetical protein
LLNSGSRESAGLPLSLKGPAVEATGFPVPGGATKHRNRLAERHPVLTNANHRGAG